MTMGQRIAERRKMLGLSQEALGEKMGVSRQAISKWESDGAIPEIDKLIGLSKLFSVSVGWLLGTEAEPADESEQAQQPDLTEAQLKMVEEIVRRYQPPQPKHTGIWIVGAAGLCCALVALVIALVGWNNANRQFPNYDSQLQNLSYDNSYIQSQLSDLRSQLDELAEGEKLLSEFETRVTMSAENATVLDVTFTGVPKTWQAGSEAYLSLRQNGLERKKVPCTWDGVAFTAQTRLTDCYSGYESYFVLLREDGTQEQQNVTDDVLENLPKGVESRLEVDGAGWELAGNVLTIRSMTLTAQLPSLLTEYAENVRWESMELQLMDGEQILLSFDMEEIGENNFELAYPAPEHGEDGSVSRPAEIYPELPGGALWLSVYDLQLTLPDRAPGTVLQLMITGEYLNVQAGTDFITLQMGEDGFYEVTHTAD